MYDGRFFTVGGTVQAGGGKYIHRKVDDELIELCRNGTFGFVLTARQMGKSSLMVRTAERLAKEGVRSVVIDLSQLGVQVAADAWYLGLLTRIEDALDLETDVFDWWEEHRHLGLTQRLTQFFQHVLEEEVDENVVIFIDEIGVFLSASETIGLVRRNQRALGVGIQRIGCMDVQIGSGYSFSLAVTYCLDTYGITLKITYSGFHQPYGDRTTVKEL